MAVARNPLRPDPAGAPGAPPRAADGVLAAHATAALFLLDSRGLCVAANPAAGALLLRSPEELRGAALHDLLHPPGWAAAEGPDASPGCGLSCPLAAARALGPPLRDHPDRVARADGSAVPVRCTATPVLHGGAAGGYVLEVRGAAAELEREAALAGQARQLEALHRMQLALAAELDLERLLQAVTDAGRALCGAEFGAFFYNAVNPKGDVYQLYTISGVPKEAFAKFPMPRATPLFAPTFRGERTVRHDDVRKAPEYGKAGPHHGMPQGHLPVRSYLAAPVVSRSGKVLGGLFYGHGKAAVFTAQAERLIEGLAAQAAIAVEHAELYRALQSELAERRRSEEALRDQSQLTSTIANNAASALFMMDTRGHPTFMNPAAEAMTGHRLEAIRGRPLHDTVHHIRADGTPYPMEACPIDQASEEVRFVKDHRDTFVRSDGSLFPVLVSAAPIVERGQRVGMVIEVRDLTERERAEEELRAANERLRELDRLKTHIINTASHELRTPLTPIQMQLFLLREALGGMAQPHRRAFDLLDRNVQRLGMLVQDMLEVSRIQGGRLVLDRRPADVARLAREAAESFEGLAREASVAVRVAAEGAVVADVDAARLTQVLYNLLSNAIKFTPAGGSVEVAARSVAGKAVVEVRDAGMGFAQDQADRLFQPFSQVHATTQAKTGTGLGLYISKGIVEAHGGRMWASSPGPGLGATFGFAIPAGPPGPTAPGGAATAAADPAAKAKEGTR